MPIMTGLALSGSTNGRPIPVAATSSPGTALHTVSTATGVIEEVYLDLFNTATAIRQITVECGGTATGNHMVVNMPAQAGPFRVLAGVRFVGATGQIIAAFATATGGVGAIGAVNRATP